MECLPQSACYKLGSARILSSAFSLCPHVWGVTAPPPTTHPLCPLPCPGLQSIRPGFPEADWALHTQHLQNPTPDLSPASLGNFQILYLMTEPTSICLAHLGTLGFYLVPTPSPLRRSHHLCPSSSQSASQLSPEGLFLKCKLPLSLTTQHSRVPPDHMHTGIQGLGHDLGRGSSWVPSPPNPLTRMASHLSHLLTSQPADHPMARQPWVLETML